MRRPGDKKTPSAGDRAAARLRLYEAQRAPASARAGKGRAAATPARKTGKK